MSALRANLFLLPAAVAGLLAGCAVVPPAEINEQYRSIIELRRNDYVVKPGDVLTLDLYRQESQLTTQSVQVLEDGRGDPFFMTSYRFGGKTIAEIEEDVRKLLSPEASATSLTPPRVSIHVAPAAEQVYVYGQVERPGTVPMTTHMTLGDALASVQGFSLTADSDYALLRRRFPDRENPDRFFHPDRFRIDLNDETEDIFLLPGDEVYVPRNCLATIVAYLREYVFGLVPSGFYSGAFGGSVTGI